jgi:hypothetical protein
MGGIRAMSFGTAQDVIIQAIERTSRLLIGLQLDLMECWDHFLPQELDGTLHILICHGPLIAINVEIARVQALNDLRQLLGYGLRVADDDVIHGAQFVVAYGASKRPGANRRKAHLHFQRLTRLDAYTGNLNELVGVIWWDSHLSSPSLAIHTPAPSGDVVTGIRPASFVAHWGERRPATRLPPVLISRLLQVDMGSTCVS